MYINHVKLETLVKKIFEAGGCNSIEASAISYHLVLANLVGHDSHGVIRVPRYIQHLKEGKVFTNITPKIITDNELNLSIDGLGGFGQSVGRYCSKLGVERAKQLGSCIIALKNSGHLGRIGDWAELPANEEIISIHFVNTTGLGLLVAPFGSYERRFSTNPFAAGIPIPNKPPFIVDFATSVVAEGKMLVAAQGGKELPENSLVDINGNFSSDPKIVYGDDKTSPIDVRQGSGAIRAMGEHKGSGLAFLCELLGGALTNSGTAKPEEKILRNGMFSIYINPDKLISKENFSEEVDRYVNFFKSAKPIKNNEDVYIPGEIENNTKIDRTKNGIPMTKTTWDTISITSDEYKIDTKLRDDCVI